MSSAGLSQVNVFANLQKASEISPLVELDLAINFRRD
jgi:hypothetical protein